MADYPPFMNSTGLVSKIFLKMAQAQKPDRFTQDYLATVLGYGSGSAKPFIPLLKRLAFLNGDGTPTQIYTRFRNPSEKPSAMLEALKTGYSAVYARNEFAHALSKDKLRDLFVEITGLERNNTIISALVGTFEALKQAGSVTESTQIGVSGAAQSTTPSHQINVPSATFASDPLPKGNGQEVGVNLAYTINLNLPPSADPEVFNAIFKALKEHLLAK